MEGPEAIDTIVGQLEGFEAPAGSWESEILPARLAGYEPAWLDDRCLAGQLTWARLRPRTIATGSGRTNGGEGRPAPVRTTPITLLARRHAAHWAALSAGADPGHPGGRAQAVADYIREHGASFFDELVDGTGLLRSEVEEALAELVALGLASSDSFGGLRALLVPSSERRPIASGRRRRRTVAFGMEDAGRWALARRVPPARRQASFEQEAIEHAARTLLLRYGVVFWRLIEREAQWLPPWRDLLRVYRRLESRGDIRGGRFVAGFAGEQFALPEAVGMLREARREPPSGALDLALRRRPAQPRGHPHARAEARGAHRQPPALSRRRADRVARGRRGAVPGDPRRRERMGGAQGSAARRAAGAVHRFAYQSG